MWWFLLFSLPFSTLMFRLIFRIRDIFWLLTNEVSDDDIVHNIDTMLKYSHIVREIFFIKMQHLYIAKRPNNQCIRHLFTYLIFVEGVHFFTANYFVRGIIIAHVIFPMKLWFILLYLLLHISILRTSKIIYNIRNWIQISAFLKETKKQPE